MLGPVAPEEKGSLLEGWVLHLLRAHGEEAKVFDEIFYWAPLGQTRTEVDFLLRRGREFLAVEVKSRERFTPEMCNGLHAIGGLENVVRKILVYTGRRSLGVAGEIEVWPALRFVQEIAQGTLWP